MDTTATYFIDYTVLYYTVRCYTVFSSNVQLIQLIHRIPTSTYLTFSIRSVYYLPILIVRHNLLLRTTLDYTTYLHYTTYNGRRDDETTSCTLPAAQTRPRLGHPIAPVLVPVRHSS